MMYYIYILRSEQNGDIYVGSTKDVQQRFLLHNQGKVKSTKGYRPWILMRTEEYNMRSDAFQREMFLKTGQQKEILRKQYMAP
ncbi:MAG: GIY-YIG nuclease family protein [Patescibacteria group bacterium]